jgi:hypothetical protein
MIFQIMPTDPDKVGPIVVKTLKSVFSGIKGRGPFNFSQKCPATEHKSTTFGFCEPVPLSLAENHRPANASHLYFILR